MKFLGITISMVLDNFQFRSYRSFVRCSSDFVTVYNDEFLFFLRFAKVIDVLRLQELARVVEVFAVGSLAGLRSEGGKKRV